MSFISAYRSTKRSPVKRALRSSVGTAATENGVVLGLMSKTGVWYHWYTAYTCIHKEMLCGGGRLPLGRVVFPRSGRKKTRASLTARSPPSGQPQGKGEGGKGWLGRAAMRKATRNARSTSKRFSKPELRAPGCPRAWTKPSCIDLLTQRHISTLSPFPPRVFLHRYRDGKERL